MFQLLDVFSPGHARKRAAREVLVTISLCTLLTGGVFVVLGTFRLTKLVQIFPQSTVSGFMGVIGYKLLAYSYTVGTMGDTEKLSAARELPGSSSYTGSLPV